MIDETIMEGPGESETPNTEGEGMSDKRSETVREIDGLVDAIMGLRPYQMTAQDVDILKEARRMIDGILASVKTYLEEGAD